MSKRRPPTPGDTPPPSRRDLLLGAPAAALAGVAAFTIPAAATAAAATGSPNLLTVGPGVQADFPEVQDAIDSIVDSSTTNHYVVSVAPGHFQPFTFSGKDGIHVVGCGAATVVETTSAGGVIGNRIETGSAEGSSLSSLRIVMVDDNPGARRVGAIQATSANRRFIMRDLDIEVVGDDFRTSGELYAVYHPYGKNVWAVRAYDLRIVSNVSGMLVAGQYDLYSSSIDCIGDGLHQAHQYGVQTRSTSRTRLFNCRIGMEQDLSTPISRDGADIIGLYVEAGARGRLFLFGCELFCRNRSATPGVVRCVKADGGWVRIFGSFLQAETAGVNGTPPTIEAAYVPGDSQRDGFIEFHGSRISGYLGHVSGNGASAASRYDHTHDGKTLAKFEASVVLADTAVAAFSLKLPRNIPGHSSCTSVRFVNTGANPLTILGQGRPINGSTAPFVLASSTSAGFVSDGTQGWWSY